MYTILMNADKSLSKTVVTTLYQSESMVDKIKFLVPRQYNGLDLTQFNTILKYTDQGNVVHTEKLIAFDKAYKNNWICYYLPIDSDIARFAGDIKIHLVFNRGIEYTLHSGDTVITIDPVDPCYQHITSAPTPEKPEDGDGGGSSGDEEGYEVVEF